MKKILSLSVLLMLCTCSVFAQTKDSVLIIKEFVNICNSFQKQPLQLNIKITTTSTFPTSVEDSMSAEGVFYIQSKTAYVKFGEIEQIVNDSIAMLVSDKLKRIFLWHDVSGIRNKMKDLSGFSFTDSSILNLSKKFSATVVNYSVNQKTIKLSSRNTLYKTAYPKEEILLHFNTVSGEPISVTHLKRKIVVLEKEVYDQLITDDKYKQYLYHNNEDGYFLVKSVSTEYNYESIKHDINSKMPVDITDRIISLSGNKYLPAKGFEQYNINVISNN